MLRRLRQALVMMVLVLYGSVSILGSGLHARTHNHGIPSSSDRADRGTGPGFAAPTEHAASSADCPMCKYLAQGQMASEPVLVVSRPHTSPHVALILASIATRDRHPSCSPRAPPLSLPSVA